MSRSESTQTAITIAFSFVLRLQLRPPNPNPYPPSPTLTTLLPLSCTHKDRKTNLKCRRCGESAFYFHGLMNKQKSKEFACFRQNLVMLHQAINKSFCKILKYYFSGRDLNIYQI